MRNARTRLLGAALAGCAALGASAPVAGAATVAHDPRLPAGASYTAGPDEENRLRIFGDTLVRFFDPVGISEAASALNDCIAPETSTGPGAAAACPGSAAIEVSLGEGDDILTTGGGAPAMTVVAGTGADALVDAVRSSATAFNGGDGQDRVSYTARAEDLRLSLNDLADDGAALEGDNLTGVEDVAGGSGADAIVGGPGANGLSGGPGGNDRLAGGGGDDTLEGGSGSDVLDGGDGDDRLIGGSGADSLAAGSGADVITAVDGVADTIDCGAGADTADVDRGAGGVTDVVANCETLTGPTAGAPAGASTAVPGLSTVRAPGVANPADLTAPAASIRAAIRQRIATVRTRGLALRVLCRESCGVSAALAIDRAAARRLRLAGRTGGAVLGTANGRRSTAGALRMRVKLSRRARQALARTRKVAVTVQVLVSDASGNGTLLQRRITLVR